MRWQIKERQQGFNIVNNKERMDVRVAKLSISKSVTNKYMQQKFG